MGVNGSQVLLDKHARILKEQLKGLWASSNRVGQRPDAVPMRYRHQQVLLDMVDEHLSKVEKVRMMDGWMQAGWLAGWHQGVLP